MKETKEVLIFLKEEIFYFLFLYCTFDLKAMANFNIIFNNIINEVCPE